MKPEEYGGNVIFMPRETRLEIFFKKYKIKIHYLLLKLHTGASKSGDQGGLDPLDPLDLQVVSNILSVLILYWVLE